MTKKLAKIAITETANQDLTAMLEKVNKDFTQGRVTKTNLLSWVVSNFHRSYFQKSIPKIQKENVDSIFQLKTILEKAKKAKRQGQEIHIQKYLSQYKA